MGVQQLGQRSASSSHIRGKKKAAKDFEDIESDPGVPKSYILRNGHFLGIQKEVQLSRPPPRDGSNSSGGALVRSRSSGVLEGRAGTPTNGKGQWQSRGRGSSLRGSDVKLTQLAQVVAQDLSQTNFRMIAHKLAGAEKQDADEPPPDGIVECRARLEAFRAAAVEAISLEALLAIDQRKAQKAEQVATAAAAKTQTNSGSPSSRLLAHGKGSEAVRCLRRSPQGNQAAQQASQEEAEVPPGIEEVKRHLDALRNAVNKEEMMKSLGVA
eukprot:TRINITY_DN14042_c1_g1_i1.p1 TRINITY_DN14042_c1_g1~~TRINITY_DN14042_c1_g1_i1.p1  ORF type:complete len:269 (-),score=65.69 TRINITY_DN14042_c1_g1_i1:264-1070(-)